MGPIYIEPGYVTEVRFVPEESGEFLIMCTFRCGCCHEEMFAVSRCSAPTESLRRRICELSCRPGSSALMHTALSALSGLRRRKMKISRMRSNSVGTPAKGCLTVAMPARRDLARLRPAADGGTERRSAERSCTRVRRPAE